MKENNYSHHDFLSSMLLFLRTPTVVIDGFSGILAEGTDGPLNPKQSFFLEMIRKNNRDLVFLLDVFSYVIRFDRDWWSKVYGQGLKADNLLLIIDEVLDITLSSGVLPIEPSIKISKEFPESFPPIPTNKELFVPIVKLMILSAAFTLPSCSKVLIKAEAANEVVDFYVICNPDEIHYKFDDLRPKYSFSNIYDSIDLEFRDAQGKRGARDFYPILLAIIHGLSTNHNAEFRMELSETSSNLVIRLPVNAG